MLKTLIVPRAFSLNLVSTTTTMANTLHTTYSKTHIYQFSKKGHLSIGSIDNIFMANGSRITLEHNCSKLLVLNSENIKSILFNTTMLNIHDVYRFCTINYFVTVINRHRMPKMQTYMFKLFLSYSNLLLLLSF